MQYTVLPARGLLKLSGSDIHSFLQGLITQDVRLLAQQQAAYAALLTPQGKFLHDFFLYPAGDAIWLDGEKDRLDDLKKRLAIYKLRSDVAIENVPEEQGVVALWSDQSTEFGVQDDKEALSVDSASLQPASCENQQIFAEAKPFPDPRMPALGWRMVGDVTASLQWCATQGYEDKAFAEYDVMRLQHGVPDGSRDMIPEKSLLLECGMDKLHAISFEKGCYVGQEVTARSKHRGQVRKLLYVVHSKQGNLPEPGAEIMLEDTQAGQMRSAQGNIGLALLRTELVEQACQQKTPLHANNLPLQAVLPDWHAQAA